MFRRRHKDQVELGTTRFFSLPGYGLHWSPLHVHETERRTHTYVIGITGTGKSKLLEHILFQDIIHGRGGGVLDPHSDLVQDLLHYLQSHPQQSQAHWERIIYFDPSRSDSLIPFNVLDTGFSPYETTQNVIEAFRRTWPNTLEEAPRFANIATAAILTLIANKLTLVEMPRLLTDQEFRDALLANVQDVEVLGFWRGRYEKWGRETPLMVESLLNKVTAFTMNPQLRLLLGAGENRLNFRRIMDEGQVLLVDLGRCDAETRRLVGSLIVTGLEQAARSRKDIRDERRPFYFCIDEFQDFCANDGAAQTLAQILSECRKFGLHLTLAHQTLAQINERMKGALGNIQLKIIFGTSRQDAEILAKHLFQVTGEKVKFAIRDSRQSGGNRPIFYSLQEEWERSIRRVQQLKPRTAYVSRPGGKGVTQIQTMTIRHAGVSGEALEQLRSTLACRTGVATNELAKMIDRRSALHEETSRPRPAIRERSDLVLESQA